MLAKGVLGSHWLLLLSVPYDHPPLFSVYAPQTPVVVEKKLDLNLTALIDINEAFGIN